MTPEQTDSASPVLNRAAETLAAENGATDAQANGAPAGARPETPTHRDVQRASLHGLVELSSDVSAAETEMDQRLDSTLASLDKGLDKASWELEQRVGTMTEGVEAAHRDKLASVDHQHKVAVNQLQQADKQFRLRADHDYRTVEEHVKGQVDQAKWLAESMCDGVQAQARAQHKKVKEVIGEHIEHINQFEARGMELLQVYGHARPPSEDPTVAADEDSMNEMDFDTQRQFIDQRLVRFAVLQAPRMFVGARPLVLVVLLLAIAGGGAYLAKGGVDVAAMGIAMGAALVVAIVLGVLLKILANKHVRQAWTPLSRSFNAAHEIAKAREEAATEARNRQIQEADVRREAEVKAVKAKLAPVIQQAMKRRETAIAAAQAEFDAKKPRIDEARDNALAAEESGFATRQKELAARFMHDRAKLKDRHDQKTAQAKKEHEDAFAALSERWSNGLSAIQAPIADSAGGTELLNWNDPRWEKWKPSRKFAANVRFGELRVDLKQITDKVPQHLALPETFSVPACLSFPKQASLLIHTDHAGRADAIRGMQMIMSRLLTTLPPGRAHFTIIDPVGLGQNFAGFMHLADHDEALVGARIWTDAEQIAQRLNNLAEHMQTVIQKYLRNEFETIDDYNAQAGELAEPYRFLVIADLPVGFELEAFRKLSSIASTGARCGVYTLVVRDTRQALPSGAHLDELRANSLNLIRQDGRFVWDDDVFRQFPLKLDDPPSEERLTQLLEVVGREAKEAKRVEVPFETIAPARSQFWTGSTSQDIKVAVGRLGATRLQSVRLGKGVAQHALIAGKTGSGKSTLLHALITNLAMWYSPDEVEFYLIDFKKGVEFKTYATHLLPHARAIAVESDREFGLSVLQRLDAELARRGAIYRKLGVQDLAAYRLAQPDEPLPRTLLIIDEFQEFFTEDDKLAQDAALLIDRLVRQGRAFGIHVLLGSQTIGGSSGLSRATIGQIAVRIALQTSEADSHLILGDGNSAARLLTRPGEAIYNDAGGLVEANSPFQVAWLPDEQRDRYLEAVIALAESHPERQWGQPIVFEGNAPADITKNLRLAELIRQGGAPQPALSPMAWLGEPVAIKDPTAIVLRRQSGANIMMIGQQDEAALAMLASSIASLSSQNPVNAARFVILDGTPADSPLAGKMEQVRQTIVQQTQSVEFRAVADVMNELAEELARRQAADQVDAPGIYIIICGLQRYRVLRKSEDSFSFGSSGDEEKKAPPDKQFADILREGPAFGIHVIAWIDTPASLERTVDRGLMREFDNRILFQMSATDSSNLIDSPAANKLGFNRALAYSEEQGTLEKFRPYGVPPISWFNEARKKRVSG